MRTIEEILKEINMYGLNESNLTELIDMYITKYAKRESTFDIKAIPFLCKSIIEDLDNHCFKPQLEEKEGDFSYLMIGSSRKAITNKKAPFLSLVLKTEPYNNEYNTSWESYYNFTQIFNKDILVVDTLKYRYCLAENCLFKYHQRVDTDIYTYYTFKENGEIKKRVFIDKIKGYMETHDDMWEKIYKITKKENLDGNIRRSSVNTEEELLQKLYNPTLFSKRRKPIFGRIIKDDNENSFNFNIKNLDIKPKATESVMYTLTDKGRVRSKNEDSVIAISHPKDESIKLLAVADGMGGYSNGEYASSYTIERLKEWFNNRTAFEFNNLNYLNANLQELIQNINISLHKESRKRLNEMGTTLTCAIVTNNKTFVLNIGDSRCYLMKDTNLKQITDDDSTVYEQYEAGILTKDDLRFHPRNNIVTQGLGITIVSPKTKIIDNDSYDKLLLFTDGVTDCLSDEKIKLIANTSSKEEILEKIIDEAVNIEQAKPKNITLPEGFRVYPTPGKDNATGAILIKR